MEETELALYVATERASFLHIDNEQLRATIMELTDSKRALAVEFESRTYRYNHELDGMASKVTQLETELRLLRGTLLNLVLFLR